MSLGMVNGMNFQQFCAVVKTMTLVFIDGKVEIRGDVPLRYFNVPIYQFQVSIEETK